MKKLSSFMSVVIDEEENIFYTYDVIDESTGIPTRENVKENFIVLDRTTVGEISAVRDFIKEKKLNENQIMERFVALNVGTDRITYYYSEIDGESGELVSQGNRGMFYVVNEELRSHINAIRDFIRTNKLEG